MSKIEIKNLKFGYDSQGTLLFEQANLNFDTPMKLGLIGRNGRGKTTLLNILQNKLPYQGQVIHEQEFVYFPQQTKDKERLTYYVLNDITDFEIWEIERELQLMQTDPEILWRKLGRRYWGERRQKSYWHFYLWMTLISR